MTTQWRIPASVLHHLERMPEERPVALLLRHSVRPPIPPGDVGNELPITDIGRRLAQELGCLLGERLSTLRTSPLARCVQTADALRTGAMREVEIVPDRLLGDPGIYVIDGHRAWDNWVRLGHKGVMQQLVSGESTLDGMAHPVEAAHLLLRHMLDTTGNSRGVHVFVTHDTLVAATAARLLQQYLEPVDWPWYLEGAFFWEDERGVSAAYRHHEVHSISTPLPALSSIKAGNMTDMHRR